MRTKHLALALFLAAVVSACSGARYVIDPPQVDLTQIGSLGLVTLKAEGGKGDLDASATQLFLQEISSAQRIPVIELGSQAAVLADLGKAAFDRDAAIALGEKQGLDAFFAGEIVVTKVKPQLDLAAPIQKTLLARTAFNVTVKVRLVSARNGATLWTRSAAGQATVGTIGIDGGVPVFAVQDKSAAMHDLLRDLMYRLTWDFRQTRRRL